MWNKFAETLAGHQRTNNTCEGFNSSFSADVEPFPSLWKVCIEFQNRARLAKATADVELVKVKLFFIVSSDKKLFRMCTKLLM